MTPVCADGKGFPDLVIVRADELWFIELKTDVGSVKPEQAEWLDALFAVRCGVTVLRPNNWETKKERFA